MSNCGRLMLLTPDEAKAAWVKVRPLLEPCIPHSAGDIEVDDLIAKVCSYEAFLTCIFSESGEPEMALVGCVQSIAKGKAMFVLALGGKGLRRITSDNWDRLISIARQMGATSIRGAVRPSIQRMMRTLRPKARVIYTTMEEEI